MPGQKTYTDSKNHTKITQKYHTTWRSLWGLEKENNSLKGPLLNHLTLEKTKQNFSSALMLQAGCIYWDLSPPVRKPSTPYTRPEDVSLPAQLQMSSQQKNTQNIPPD